VLNSFELTRRLWKNLLLRGSDFYR